MKNSIEKLQKIIRQLNTFERFVFYLTQTFDRIQHEPIGNLHFLNEVKNDFEALEIHVALLEKLANLKIPNVQPDGVKYPIQNLKECLSNIEREFFSQLEFMDFVNHKPNKVTDQMVDDFHKSLATALRNALLAAKYFEQYEEIARERISRAAR